jgi:hypothetical protein
MKYKNLWQNFLNAHQLTLEQLKDKEYIDSLYENFLENVEYRVDGKLYGHYTSDGKLTNKYIN